MLTKPEFLIDTAIASMTKLQEAINQDDDAFCTMPHDALSIFIDEHLMLVFRQQMQKQLPTYDELLNALKALLQAQHGAPVTEEMLAAWTEGTKLMKRFSTKRDQHLLIKTDLPPPIETLFNVSQI